MATKVLALEVTVETGEAGPAEDPVLLFNGHELPLEAVSGRTAAGETFVGRAAPRSVAHRVELRGPSAGRWLVTGIRVAFTVEGRAPYAVRLGGLELDPETAVDIWRPPPPEVFEV